MRIEEAQSEMRRVYLGGSVGAFVCAVLWLASAAIATWGSGTLAVYVLMLGGAFIFPAMTLVLKLMGRPTLASKENPLNKLAMQVAFTVPLSIPLILAATKNQSEWFYAGFLIVVGAHYLPFVTLYGMQLFYGVAAVMIGAGVALPILQPGVFAIGGWFGGAMFVVLGVWLTVAHAAEAARLAGPGAAPTHSP
jgi:uncharacterized protein DUF7010